MAHGTHDYDDDPRNEHALVSVNAELVPRERAVVSVFDAGFVLGDGVWEGLRVTAGHPAFLERHLDRLYEGAAAIALDVGRTREQLSADLYALLSANEMTDGVHVRLMVTRGVKRTPYQDPRVTAGPATIVMIAEHKQPLPATVEQGITLFTTHVRRATPDTLDPKLNSHSKLNDITACIQAYTAGADEALMLDPHGFVATCNSTHFFVVRRGDPDEGTGPEVWTSDGRFCLGGITRGNVLRVCREAGITARETTFSLTDVYGASEAFCTGTFAGVVPVREVDGRRIGDGTRGPVVTRLQRLYADLVARDVSGPVGSRIHSRINTVTQPPGRPVRLAVWSGPRNISTALMRSWENRTDTVVVDEPLYPAFLARTGIDHPGRDEVLAVGETDLDRAVASLQGPLPPGTAVHYQKHMCHHLPDGPVPDWVSGLTTLLLVRDPREVVASYVRSRADVVPADIGLLKQERLLDTLLAAGQDPPVIDAGDFLRDPEAYLRWWCGWLGVAFTDRMLHWPAGPRDSDGVWAPHWYAAVLASTGFEPWRPREIDLSTREEAVAEACRAAYERLHTRRVVL